MFQQVLKRACKGGKLPCTVFILDEVQQYIGTSVDRSVTITEIAEVLSKQLDSQVMLVGAGQSALSGQQLLAKMLDRFLIRIQLSDADVEVVTREVLLQKKPTARAEVERLLSQNAGEVSRQLQGTKIGQRTSDQDIIVDDYPLLPVRRRFWEECFRQVDAAGTQSQLRSQLGIIHESLEHLADRSLGTVIPADQLYSLLASKLIGTAVLPRGIYDRISALQEELARRVCGLVFLIGQLKTEAGVDIGVRATAEHIGDLLVEDLTADNGRLRSTRLQPGARQRRASRRTRVPVGGRLVYPDSVSVSSSKLVDAPVAEIRRIDGSPAVHGYVMWGINLAGNLSKRSHQPQNLAVQIDLDDARIGAVAHVSILEHWPPAN